MYTRNSIHDHNCYDGLKVKSMQDCLKLKLVEKKRSYFEVCEEN